jgi:hypothetical protein
MPSTKVYPPFEAYKGSDLYAFISYAHADSEIIFLEITFLKNMGVNIWYDEGIDPGNEWPDEIAKALDGSALFVFFATPHSVASKNCRNEVNYALNSNKAFLAIYLEETSLPPGLALRISDIQAIMKYNMDRDSYRRKLEKAIKGYISDIQKKALVICKNCGRSFNPDKGGVCSYHPEKAKIITNTGPRYDYAEYYEFPCCKMKVFGEVTQDGVDLLPPQTPGCKIGRHVPTGVTS